MAFRAGQQDKSCVLLEGIAFDKAHEICLNKIKQVIRESKGEEISKYVDFSS